MNLKRKIFKIFKVGLRLNYVDVIINEYKNMCYKLIKINNIDYMIFLLFFKRYVNLYII